MQIISDRQRTRRSALVTEESLDRLLDEIERLARNV
jgi:hypothetical protein